MMSGLYRTLVGIVALGAGVVSLGLATNLPLPALVVLALSAFLELGLALWVLAARRVRAIHAVIALLPSALWLVLAPASGRAVSDFTFWSGLLLNVVFAALLVASTRSQAANWEPKRGAAFLGIAALTGLLMGLVATPALAATTAGQHGQEHGGMGGMPGMSHTDTEMGSMPGMGH